MERQGVKLEKSIRELGEKTDRERAEAGIDVNENGRESLGPEVRICLQRFLYCRNRLTIFLDQLQAEDLIVQLFDLVNEKNELFRRQTELMYMKRDHRLEEEHADTEHQERDSQCFF